MGKKKDLAKWLYWFTFAVAVIFVYKTLDNFTEITEWLKSLLSLLSPFLIGTLIAYILYIPSRMIERGYEKSKVKWMRKKARGLSVVSIYIIVLLLILLIIKFIWPAITESVIELINNVPTYYTNIIQYLQNLPEDSIFNKMNVLETLQSISLTELTKQLDVSNIGNYAKGLLGVANGIFNIFVTIIVSVYVLLERRQILNFVKKIAGAIFKEDTYQNLGVYFAKSNEIFFKFISSQVLDGIIIGIVVSIAMLILDVKYAVLLGFMIGLFNLIPYFGAIIAVSLAILITIFTGGFGQALWLAIIVIILQQIDANIINPKIVGNSLKLSPLLVIFAVTVGGAYFGVLGMFLAVPIITILKIYVNDFIDYKNRRKLEENKKE